MTEQGRSIYTTLAFFVSYTVNYIKIERYIYYYKVTLAYLYSSVIYVGKEAVVRQPPTLHLSLFFFLLYNDLCTEEEIFTVPLRTVLIFFLYFKIDEEKRKYSRFLPVFISIFSSFWGERNHGGTI